VLYSKYGATLRAVHRYPRLILSSTILPRSTISMCCVHNASSCSVSVSPRISCTCILISRMVTCFDTPWRPFRVDPRKRILCVRQLGCNSSSRDVVRCDTKQAPQKSSATENPSMPLIPTKEPRNSFGDHVGYEHLTSSSPCLLYQVLASRYWSSVA